MIYHTSAIRRPVGKSVAYRFLLSAFYFLFFALCFSSCDNEDYTVSKPSENFRPAADFIRNNYEFTLFYAALERTGMIDQLNGKGPFTVFVPGDEAFHELGIAKAADFDRMDVDSLRFMLQYHILNRPLSDADVPRNSVDNRYMNLAGTELLMTMPLPPNYAGDILFVNGAKVTRANIPLANGMLHVLDKVLKYDPVSVQNILAKDPAYTLFTAALKKFGLWDQLSGTGPWTVMAPTNAAFEKHGLTAETIGALDPSRYGKRLFGAYLFPTSFFKTDLSVLVKPGGSGYYAQSSAPVRLPIVGDEDYSNAVSATTMEFFVSTTLPYELVQPIRLVNFGQVSRIDYASINGVVHEIEDLALLPEETVN